MVSIALWEATLSPQFQPLSEAAYPPGRELCWAGLEFRFSYVFVLRLQALDVQLRFRLPVSASGFISSIEQ